jgi:RNA-directed DNA polymerase
VLDELDQELKRRGHKFARYTNDCNTYVRSHRASERVMESVTRFLTAKLKLKVNSEKSAVWKQWKRGCVRFAELTARGVGKDLAALTVRGA